MALIKRLPLKLECASRKCLVFKGACKFRVSQKMILKAKTSLCEIFCAIIVVLISF